jgi:asparagine synthase (glutamine-hydrolysing)
VELPAEGADDVRSSLESWNWQERQAKFIANAVRVYEFWGYEWRLPFWDAEVVDFWAAVPPALRHRSMLLRSALKRQAARLGLPEPLEPPAATLRGAARLMAPTATDIAARMIRRARRRHEYFEHPMGWYGAVPWPVFRELYTGAEDVASFVARERAGRRA